MGDFHLTELATPAIDQVAVLAEAGLDFDGELRPAGTLADIGADEYMSQVSSGALNFSDYSLGDYGGAGQNRKGTVTVEDGGNTLRLVGDRWVKIDLPYVVTRNTVLEFDFYSSRLGDIHGIGFDNDLKPSADLTFKLLGTEAWGIPTYAADSGSTTQPKRFVIPVGEHYQGTFKYLFFAMDHDVKKPNAESVFSNVRIYERTAATASATSFSDYTLDSYGWSDLDDKGRRQSKR
jgi:hypothetical protein